MAEGTERKGLTEEIDLSLKCLWMLEYSYYQTTANVSKIEGQFSSRVGVTIWDSVVYNDGI